jgi:DNA-binding SARP family transcriptional activator
VTSLHLHLLGVPDVRMHGQPVHLRTRKMLGLLIYLAVEEQPHSRGELAELLWHDTPNTARAALRLALHHLGLLLGPGGGLDIDRNRVQLRRDGLWVDALILEARSSDHSREPEPADADLWHGDFLEGLVVRGSPAWDDWLSQRTQHFSECYDTLLARLGHHQLARGLVWDAVATARRRLSYQPLQEDAYLQLARAYLGAGQSAEAHETLRRCREVLERDLGLQPAAETVAFEGHLLSLTRPGANGTALPAALAGGALIGRTAEFAQLAEVYHRAARRAPQAAVLGGEPGIGKTRLAGELLVWAQSRGAQLLRGRALETASQPYAPLTEALHREEARLVGHLSVTQRRDLARLLPGRYGASPEPAEGDMRPRLHEALSAAILALAPQMVGEPLVLLIDDLQWADASTLDALLHLAARLAETLTPLFMLLTARAEYLSVGQPLNGWLSRLQRFLPLSGLILEPLSERDTRHLLRGALPRAGALLLDRLAQWLYSETGGQPLYLTETLRGLLESGALTEEGSGLQLHESRLPRGVEGVRAAIAERLGRLSPAALALAQAAAVLGRGEPFEVLFEVAGLEPEAATLAYEELLRCGLLVEQSGNVAALSHDRVREALRDALASPRRAALHRRAFRSLGARLAPPAVLAAHAAQGNLAAEATLLYEHAAGAAREVGAYADAMTALERALDLLPRRREQQAARVRLRIISNRLSFAQHATLSTAVAVTRRAAAEAAAAGLPGEQAALLNIVTTDLLRSGRLDEAETCAHGALAAARASGQARTESQALLGLARIETARWNWPAAEAYGERACRVAGAEHEDVALLADLALAIARRWSTGALEEARAQIAALLPRARAFERRSVAPVAEEEGVTQRVLWELVWQDIHVGAYDEALIHLQELDGVGGRPWEMICEMRGLIHLRRGDLPAALTATGAALEKAERCHLRFPNVYGIWAVCLLWSGELEEARRAVTRGQSINPAYDHVRDRADSALRFGEVLFALGDEEGALREYRWVLGTYSLPHVLGALLGVAEVWVRRGEVEMAAGCCGVVRLHGAAGRFQENRAQEVLDQLRSAFPDAQIEEAVIQTAGQPLAAVVEHVLNLTASPPPAEVGRSPEA